LRAGGELPPAMAAGVTDRACDVSDIAAIVEAAEANPAERGPYKKRMVV